MYLRFFGGAIACLTLLVSQVASAAWSAKSASLMTRWSSEVSPQNVLPEYPRPQMQRDNWLNLNGEWEFAPATAGEAVPFGRTLPQTILVPFAVESALSGIMEKHDRMWYRRSFTFDERWKGQRVLLHFGAVDWEAQVYVNGTLVGSHRGGQDAFSFDISQQLKAGSNEIIVGVYDPTDASENVVGKQVNNPEGIWYTSASGIWQTVWLEPVPQAYIKGLSMTPDLTTQELRLVVDAAGASDETVEAVAYSNGVVVGSSSGRAGETIRVPVGKAHLWTPEDPYLYDIEISLQKGSTPVDQVKSYFGMRSIKLATIGGVLRPVLNGKFVFQIGTLDQGYWPDGIYTAPTDAALRFDLEQHKALGYNMVRKHIKVEPARWYYWADRLGLLVWQDMPSMRVANPSDAARAQFEVELRELIAEHKNYPSIVMWVLQNEGWGQHDHAYLADLAKKLDPSRLVNNMSGVNCCNAKDGGNGDVIDWHVYVGPGSPIPNINRAAVLGEFGGLGLKIEGHTWSNRPVFSYELEKDSESLTKHYVNLMEQLSVLTKSKGLSAAVYTEIVDVENELNGLLTYDRQIMKVDANAVRAAHQRLIEASRSPASPLGWNRYVSFQVVSPGYTDRFVRHQQSLARTDAIGAGSELVAKSDATFKVVAGLGNSACYSFEASNYPGHYLRHQNYRLRIDAWDGGSDQYRADATFCARDALDGSGNISLESSNLPGFYVRHRNGEVWLDAFDQAVGYRQDATWHLAPAWLKSSVPLPLNVAQSLRVKTPSFTDRYVRHYNGLGYTEIVNNGSAALLKQDASFRIVPGLAENSCYSFESVNYPGSFFRHAAYRLRIDHRDGSRVFDEDATFCAQKGMIGAGVSFASFNYPTRFLRHAFGELWISTIFERGAADESLQSFAYDASWDVVPAWWN